MVDPAQAPNSMMMHINVQSTGTQVKMLPYIEQMRKNVADDLNVGIDDVNIKATTTEKLGFEGRGEGISATAVVLLK